MYLSLRFLFTVVNLLVDFVNLENQWIKLHGVEKTPMSDKDVFELQSAEVKTQIFGWKQLKSNR